MHRTLIIGFIVLVILAVGGLVAYQRTSTRAPVAAANAAIPEGARVVTLTKDGFEPAELTIQEGEVVAFRTTTGMPFWPASNPHPAHSLYPVFDPQNPVQPNAVWSFIPKAGTWRYHDHLAPYFTGTITVTPKQ